MKLSSLKKKKFVVLIKETARATGADKDTRNMLNGADKGNPTV